MQSSTPFSYLSSSFRRRKEIANRDPNNLDYHQPPPVSKPVVSKPAASKKVTVQDPQPAPTPPGPGVNTSGHPPPVPLGLVGVAGVTSLPLPGKGDPQSPDKQRKEPAAETGRKKEVKFQTPSSDFDDYRNGSPVRLPEPEPAPAPAAYKEPVYKASGVQAASAAPTALGRQGLEF